MPYLKDVYIDVITDVSFSETSTTTDHALEDGEQITDHVVSNPITISLKGIIKDDTENKVLKLRDYRQKGEILTYDYMSQLQTVVITDFKRDYSANVKDGYAFTMLLKQIKLAKVAQFVPVTVPVQEQTKTVTSKGRQQPKKTQTATATDTKSKYTNTKTASNGRVMTQ